MSVDDLRLVDTAGDQERVEDCLNRTDCLFITAAVQGKSALGSREQGRLLRVEIEKSDLVYFRAKGVCSAAFADAKAAASPGANIAEIELFIVANSRFSPLDFITLSTHWCGMFGQKRVLVTCPDYGVASEGHGLKRVGAEANYYDAQRSVLDSAPYVPGETPCRYFASIFGSDFSFTSPWQILKDEMVIRFGSNIMSASCAYGVFKKCYPELEARAWNPYDHKPVPDGAYPRRLFKDAAQ